MELHRIVIRVFFAYIFLLILLRLDGKRLVAQGTPFDFVLALVLGDMIDDAIWSEVPIAQFAVATTTLVVAQTITSLLSYSNLKLWKLFQGEPLLFMRGGSLVQPALRAARANHHEVEEMIRLAGDLEREDWNQVKSARIEKNGEPSVITQEWAQEAQKSDLELVKKKREEGKK